VVRLASRGGDESEFFSFWQDFLAKNFAALRLFLFFCVSAVYRCFMSALVIREFGSPLSVLEHRACAPPPPCGPGEALVKILASPLNPADLNWIEGTYGKRPILPSTPGTEAVGEVLASEDPAFPPGTRVIFLGYAHGWQSRRVVATSELLAVPADVPLMELAMLKVNPATAWRMLHDFVSLAPGDVILQNAANSAVGQCVIQIARALGLRSINFVRRPELADDLRALGADQVFCDDEEGKQQALDFLRAESRAVSLALNAVGGDSALRLCDLLAEGGTLVTYGAMSRRPLTIPNKHLIFRGLRLTGFWLSPWLERASAAEVAGTYVPLIELIRGGQLRTAVDRVYDLADYAAALDRLKARDRRGKVLFATEG
jgi:trans-2-enoyl-CoA reductase